MAWLDSSSDYFSDLALSGETEARFALHLAAAQGAITKYLGRDLALAEHDEIITPIGEGLILRHFPIVSVARLLADSVNCLTLENTSAEIATYSVTADGLKLLDISNGLRGTVTISFADALTIGELAEAINEASGAYSGWPNGWNATADTEYQSYPSSDLVAGQFGSAKGYSVRARKWREDSTRYEVDLPTGIVRGEWYYPVRVVYSAGFASVPEEILEIVAQLARNGYEGNAAVQSETLGGYSYSIATASEMMQRLGTNAAQTLKRYRNLRA